MSQDIQASLFQQIRAALPPSTPLAENIAAVLNISSDSAYRRIRGDKNLSLEEITQLCRHFRISMDALMNVTTDAFMFTGRLAQSSNFSFAEYLNGVLQQLKYFNSFRDKKMFYLCKDIPLFHHFHFREIAAFKYYFWMKNILHAPEFVHKKFSMQLYPDAYFETGKQILEYYNQLDSTELWNIESVNSTMRQIEFYHDSNIFTSDEEIYTLYEALGKLVDHLERQATEGRKFDAHDESRQPKAVYQMYFNEILLLENAILVHLDGTKTAFLMHSVINVLMTRDVRFTENMQAYIQNLVRKSTLISTVSEKERARFFKQLRTKIENRKQNLRV